MSLNSGYGFRSRSIFKAQLERGWQPVVLSFPELDESDSGYWRHPKTVDGIRYYYRPLFATSRFFPSFVFRRRTVALARRIQALVEAEKPDVLHAHSPVLNGVAALRVSQKSGIPFVYEVRSLWEEAAVAHAAYEQHSRQFKRLRALETWVCQNADQVAVISQGLKDHLAGRGIPPDKISVAGNGVDLDVQKRGEPEAEYRENWKLAGKKVVAYLGSFRRYEGIDLLVKAVARLSKSSPDIVLLLIGGGRVDVEAELRALVERLNLRDKVIMPGWLPPERIPGVYAVIDVLAYPRNRILLTETVTPLKPLEAMAMRKALIASDVGGHRELIQPGYNGLLFPAGSESDLAETIARLLDDQDLRQRLACQAAAWVERERSWRKTTSVYAEIYDKAQKMHSSPHGRVKGSRRSAAKTSTT